MATLSNPVLRFLGLAAVLFLVACEPYDNEWKTVEFDDHARFSPDCSRIAFVRDTAYYGSSGIFVINADGSDERLLCAGWQVAWAPDGKTLAVVLRSDYNLWEVDAWTGEPLRMLLDTPWVNGTLDWSRDGKWLTFNGYGQPYFGVCRLNLETGECRSLAYEWSDARWSEDSRRLTFNGNLSPDRNLSGACVSESSGKHAAAVLPNTNDYTFRNPCWVGDSIACGYYSSLGENWPGGIALSDTLGNWRPLTLSGSPLDYDPQTKTLLFQDWVRAGPHRGTYRLFTIKTDGTGRRQLTFGSQ